MNWEGSPISFIFFRNDDSIQSYSWPFESQNTKTYSEIVLVKTIMHPAKHKKKNLALQYHVKEKHMGDIVKQYIIQHLWGTLAITKFRQAPRESQSVNSFLISCERLDCDYHYDGSRW